MSVECFVLPLLIEASGDSHSTCSKDIVSKLYQEFKDVFDKVSLELLDWKKWDDAIELVSYAQMFSTKVHLLALVEQTQLDEFLNENLRSRHIYHPNH